MNSVQISLPAPLRKYTHGQHTVVLEAATVLDALLQLDRFDASISSRLLQEDRQQPREFVNIYLDGRHIRDQGGLQAVVPERARLDIVTAFAGG